MLLDNPSLASDLPVLLESRKISKGNSIYINNTY